MAIFDKHIDKPLLSGKSYKLSVVIRDLDNNLFDPSNGVRLTIKNDNNVYLKNNTVDINNANMTEDGTGLFSYIANVPSATTGYYTGRVDIDDTNDSYYLFRFCFEKATGFGV